MRKRILTAALALVGLYILVIFPRIPVLLESRRIDSGMTYTEFARPFTKINTGWSEQQVVETYGEPSRIEIDGDERTLIYEWYNLDVNWLLENTSGREKGGVSISFRDGKMSSTGWSDMPF